MKAKPVAPSPVRHDVTRLTDDDLHLFNEGRHYRLYDKLGAHPMTVEGEPGTYFAVWAPDAEQVTVIGDFNGWNRASHPLQPRDRSGIWEGFVPGVKRGWYYKYHIVSRYHGYRVDKADPFAFWNETPPKTASVVWELDYEWNDRTWLDARRERNRWDRPLSVYEVHAGSWRRIPEAGDQPLGYRELAHQLADYADWMGFTHVELLPVMEHPFYGSWGYQVTGYFAPTSRHGTPQDFMAFVDTLHQRGLGVVLDWVPSHFPADQHGLAYFDGTFLYEHADPRKRLHPDWQSWIFNYDRHEVRSFLLSSAMFWLDRYHGDGLRVDAVASMLYLDYSRKAGEWEPNPHGGKENIEAIRFLRQFNEAAYGEHPDILTIAEESTAWPAVSRATYVGGLGFGMKWDLGWMHDTLDYFSHDPIHRRYHHDRLTFRMLYSFTENFVLPLSHDEVVHSKGSLLRKMPGDDWQKFANLRLLFGWMFGQPGKKHLFMGGEFGQWDEWYHEQSLDWHVAEFEPHRGVQLWVRDLNRFYRTEPALHELDFDPAGFEWIDCHDSENSVVSFLRKGHSTNDLVLAVYNFTPVPRFHYRIGVPRGGHWSERLNSDALDYWGSGLGNVGGFCADEISAHGRPCSLNLTLPPLAALFFKSEGPPR
jgi:1,4-alpha-glucan branching enzyme